MVLDWFGKPKRSSIGLLISRKNYKKAIEALKGELQKRRKDRRLRLQLADVLLLAGRKAEAIEIWNVLADDLVLAGLASQAIAVLKKIQAAEPGRTDVEEKLVYLIDQQSRPTEDPWMVARRRRELEGPSGLPELGMEEIGDEPELGMEVGGEEAASATPAEPAPVTAEAAQPVSGVAAGTPAPQPDATTAADAPAEDFMRDELMALIEDVFRPLPEGLAAAETQASGAEPPPGSIESPLFKDLSREELAAFVQGLRLVTVEPGEIVVTEGEPRGSLFVITSGTLRAYVRHTSGRSLPIRDLHEGDFFGEISILSGSPRTATITAATRCELLELDRSTLEGICKTHPHMWVVLKDFHDQRANNTVEAAIRQMALGGSV